MKTLILTPNKNVMCGMYQLAKDLAKEHDGVILTKSQIELDKWDFDFEQIITLFYPMHKFGKIAKEYGKKWICYDQGIPPVTKKYFPKFWRRQYMKCFSLVNTRSMEGADEYWDIGRREQKPRWLKKSEVRHVNLGYNGDYALYLGRTTDYKNYDWLVKTMEKLDIRLIHLNNCSDNVVHEWLSNAKLLVTASLWEGYGRPVMEAQALGIPTVSYDTGTHKKHTKKGYCVPVGDENAFKQAVIKVWKK